jgi:hypothetical protein
MSSTNKAAPNVAPLDRYYAIRMVRFWRKKARQFEPGSRVARECWREVDRLKKEWNL